MFGGGSLASGQGCPYGDSALSSKQRAALDALPDLVTPEDRERFFRFSELDQRFVPRFGDSAVDVALMPGSLRMLGFIPQVNIDSEITAHRAGVAREFVADLVHCQAQMKTSKARLGHAVAATSTSLTDIRGIWMVTAAMIIGHVGDIARFKSAAHFASYNGTAPIEASSGERRRHRLNQRGRLRKIVVKSPTRTLMLMVPALRTRSRHDGRHVEAEHNTRRGNIKIIKTSTEPRGLEMSYSAVCSVRCFADCSSSRITPSRRSSSPELGTRSC